MWKSDKTKKLIENLEKSDRVAEIIIIDNDYKNKNIDLDDFSKIVYLKMNENIYVNPAWNLGVSKSNFDVIGILNDDLLFDIGFIKNLIVNSDSLIGLSENCYKENQDNIFRIEETNIRNWGFGCILFFNKKDYMVIPEDLKIWYGDDFLFKNFRYRYKIEGIFVETKMSSTSDLEEFNDIKRNDTDLYNSIYQINK